MNCEFCGRVYKRESNYKKHISTCRLLQDETSMDKLSLPSQDELYRMVVTLVKDQEKMKKEIKELKKNHISKRKVDVVSWLSENYVSEQNIEDWIDRIDLDLTHFTLVISAKNYLSGVGDILKVLLSGGDIPIRSFKVQPNNIYVYSNTSWRLMQEREIQQILNIVGKQLLNLLNKWEEKYERLMNNEEYMSQYLNNVQTIMGGGFSFEEMCKRTRKNLYDIVKMNLDNIVELEFTF